MFQHNPANNYEYWKRRIGLDITHRCMLQCHMCQRARHGPNAYKNGNDLSIENFKKVCKSFTDIKFCGQVGDAIYHPKFHDLLDVAIDYDIKLRISTNGHGKKDSWWDKSFEKMNSIRHGWTFGLDGLPKDSSKYRINQDGEDVWRQMLRGVAAGNNIEWQYIVFSYNENNIDEAKKMAKDNGITFILLESGRWRSHDDPLKPSKHFLTDPMDKRLGIF